MVRFFCTFCQKSQPVIIEEFKKDNLNGDKVWGDIVCSQCCLVLNSVEADEPGFYDFVLSKKTS